MLYKDKGFTLIEVLVSISLLGILAIVFLPAITSQFRWLVDTKDIITKNAFSEQDTMESYIKMVQNSLLKGEIDIDDYESLNISRKVESIKLFDSYFSSFNSRQYPNAYQIEISIDGNRNFTTLVSDKRIPNLPVPIIEAKSLYFFQDGAESLHRYEYFNYPNLKLKATSNMKENPSNSFNRFRSDWYVSKPGFNIPVQSVGNINEDEDFGKIYPSFPDDYISVPIYSELGSNYTYVSIIERIITAELENSYINDYPGRHILYTITPFAKSLKKGITSKIMPKYVYGPSVTNNLDLHFEASTIDLNDLYHATNNHNGTLFIQNDNYNIRTWRNTRPSVKSPTTNRNATQTTVNNMPVLVRYNIPGDDFNKLIIPFQEGQSNQRVWSRAIGNKGSTMSTMSVSNITMSNSWSVFLVMRRVENPLAPSIGPIIKGNGSNNWSISWDGQSNNPTLSLNTQTNSAILSSSLNLDEWYLVQATKDQSNLSLKVYSLKKGSNHNLSSFTTTSDNVNTNNIDILFNGVEISEILLYNANMSLEDLDLISAYLKNKYNPSF